MGAIKNIVDLLTQLNSIIQKIQLLLLAVQDENAARAAELSALKKKILELEEKYSSSEVKLSAPQEESSAEKAPDKYEFIEEKLSTAQEESSAEKAPDKYEFIEEKLSAPPEKSSAEKPPDKSIFINEELLAAQEKSSAEKVPEQSEFIGEKQHAPQEKSAAENLQNKYEFVRQFGIYKAKESGLYFCPSCLKKNIEYPLTEKLSGWQCEFKKCGEFYVKPGYKTTKRKEVRRPFQW